MIGYDEKIIKKLKFLSNPEIIIGMARCSKIAKDVMKRE